MMGRSAGRALRAATLITAVAAVTIVGSPTGLAAQDAVDVSGAWTLAVESPNGAGTRDVVFAQDGAALTGNISSTRASGPFTGTVTGNEITFVATVQMDSGPFIITYAATVSGDSMEGIIDFGSYGGGTFTGQRVLSEPR